MPAILQVFTRRPPRENCCEHAGFGFDLQEPPIMRLNFWILTSGFWILRVWYPFSFDLALILETSN
jgi:hypothetical protein